MSRRAVPLRRLFGLCLLTFCAAMPALAQGTLANPSGQADPALCAGRRHRPDRPALGGEAATGVRPAIRHRQPRRCVRRDRHRGGRAFHAGRLHVAAHAGRHADRAAAAAQGGLRRAQGFRAGGRCRRSGVRLRHRAVARHQLDQGVGGLRQEEPRQTRLWVRRARYLLAHADRDAEAEGRHRHPARAVSRQRRRVERSAVRTGADDERDQCAAARQGGQAEAARHQLRNPASGLPRCAHADRGGLSGCRRADPVHHPGAGGGFDGHHRGVEPQDPGDRQDAGDDRPHARDQCGRAAVDAGAGGGGTGQGDRSRTAS